MGIMDMFNSEDRVQVKFSDFYNLIREATKAEFLMNGVIQRVNPFDTHAIITGKEHPDAEQFRCDSDTNIGDILKSISEGFMTLEKSEESVERFTEEKDAQKEQVSVEEE